MKFSISFIHQLFDFSGLRYTACIACYFVGGNFRKKLDKAPRIKLRDFKFRGTELKLTTIIPLNMRAIALAAGRA